MNTYVMGEIATLLAVTVLAGMLVGWCIKSLMTGRTERKVRAHVARDVDDAAADVANIRQTLLRREAQLKDANQELQKMRGRDVSMKAGNTNQIDEINKLKNELALARQSLDRNRSEFNSFRNDKQTEIQGLGNKLASFQSGGSAHDERMSEASETIGALRTAVRENDKVIDSLRARIKEGDSSVENLRTQLQSSETQLKDAQGIKQTTESSIAKLNLQLQDTTSQRDKFKRDYESMLENKNKEISRQQHKLEELGKVQTSVAQKEHEYKKLTQESQSIAARSNAQINDLKGAITEKEAQRAESLKNLKRMQGQITELEAKNKTLVANAEKQNEQHGAQLQKTNKELESAKLLSKQVENKSAEVVALNDMLKDVSTKRTNAQTRVTELEKQLKTSKVDAATTAEAQTKISSITAMLQDRDATVAKLRADMEDLVVNRNGLSIELGELQTTSEKSKAALIQQSEQQVKQMQSALQDRDKSFDKLRSDMDQMSGTRDRLTRELEKLQQHGSQLETFKASMQSTVAQRDSELQQRKAAYEKLQREFQQLANTRDDYEKRISALTTEVKAQAQQLQEQEKRSTQEITQLQPQIATLRSKLSLADSDNQKLSSELANAASLKLAVTERDSTIQKLRVDLQDAQMNGASSPAHDDAIKKVDSLTIALKDRDTEISRLNNIVTDNRLGSKKQHSEVTLLQQEIESQSSLIKGLEEQAENTLTLHKKIAAQSTEIEDLRASLYANEGNTAGIASQSQTENQALLDLKTQLQQQSNETASIRNQLAVAQQSLAQAQVKIKQPAPATDKSMQTADLKLQVAKLQSELEGRNTDIQRLQKQNSSLQDSQTQVDQLRRQIDQRERELSNARQQQSTTAPATPTTQKATANSKSSTTPRAAATKPRVFVRQEDKGVNATESLTGVTSLNTTGRAAYTRDGYRLQRTDGSDNLTLLPGIDAKAERELNNNGVTDFEQISLWGRREIAHFSDRVGVAAAEADSYDWPKLAREIIAGSYRHADYKEKDNS